MTENVNQNKNIVKNGDIIGGDKIIIIKKDVAKASTPIRDELNFELDSDSENTTLIRKLEVGKVNKIAIQNAIRIKVLTLGHLLNLSKKEKGKNIVSDIYENLISLINSRYIVEMENEELLKTKMKDISDDFTSLVKKYEDIIPIDEALLEGLLYIATSNCAMRWKVE